MSEENKVRILQLLLSLGTITMGLAAALGDSVIVRYASDFLANLEGESTCMEVRRGTAHLFVVVPDGFI